MSAIIGRFLFAVGIGVVSAMVYTFFKENNQREQHSQTNRRRRTGYDDSDYRSRTSWGGWDHPDDDDDDSSSRRRCSKVSSNRSETKEDKENCTKEPTSLQGSCPICLESFQDLKRKGLPIFTTPCGHIFCYKCLKQAASTNHVCPSCRVEISFTNCHRIFL